MDNVVRARGLLVVALGVALAVGATPALAGTGGTIRIFAVPPTSPTGVTGSVVVTGAIGDYGTGTTANANGTPDPNGNYVKVALHKGGFFVNITTLNKRENAITPSFNAVDCSGSFSVTAPASLGDGTGAYKGISGTVTLTVNVAFIGPTLTSGPHKGQCNPSHNVAPLSTFSAVIGSGTVSFT